jgi:arylsulfatase A-like enzyme
MKVEIGGRLRLLAASAAGLLVAFAATAEAAQARPNVVLIIADDQTWLDTGAYGNPQVPTPNIDRLAAEGMRFDASFTATAMCSPTRQQLYTGLYPVRSGAYPNHAWVKAGTRGIVHDFRDLGYRVGLTGKTHIGPPESFPFEVVGAQREGELAPDNLLAGVDLEAAEAFVTRDRAQPFLLVVASNSPHEPWTHGDPDAFDRAALRVPPYLADSPATREALARYYAEITHLDGQIGAVLAILERAGRTSDTIVVYTSEQGTSLPFAKWTLYDAGTKTGLVVRWPGHVRAGSTTKAMVAYVDVLPTLLEAVGGTPPAGLDGRSFLGVATGKSDSHRDHVFGVHTNRGIIGGNDYPIRSVRSAGFKLIRNLMPENEYANVLTMPRGRTVLDSWKAAGEAGDAHAAARYRSYLRRPALELYDLAADPSELHNLAGDPRYAGVQRDLSARLDAWMAEQGDRGIETEREALEHIDPALQRELEQELRERSL